MYLSVRAGGSTLIPIGLGGFETTEPSSDINTVRTTIDSDLLNSGFFNPIVLTAAEQDIPGGILAQWKAAGAKYYLFGDVGNDRATVVANLIDLNTSLTIFTAKYRIDPERPWYTAHVIVDDLIEHFTGLRGGFASRIAFVRKTKDGDEIFIMDADGRNIRQLTFSKTLNMSPAWSPDGGTIAYSSLYGGNWLIMMTDIKTGQSVDVTQWPVLNTTPAWSPVEAGILAFSSTRDGGNTEIYTYNVSSRDIRRLTNNMRIDHSPAWSPDGTKIAFVSDRMGNPLIYMMNSDGTGQHRLTATPNAYEDSPSWSPQGDRIVFVMMSDYGFDIASCSPSGDDVIVLTFAQGSNEDPQWSPDGLRIIFTSTRVTGTKRLFIMNRDGSNVRPLLTDGINYSPSWAPAVSGNDIRVSTQR